MWFIQQLHGRHPNTWMNSRPEMKSFILAPRPGLGVSYQAIPCQIRPVVSWPTQLNFFKYRWFWWHTLYKLFVLEGWCTKQTASILPRMDLSYAWSLDGDVGGGMSFITHYWHCTSIDWKVPDWENMVECADQSTPGFTMANTAAPQNLSPHLWSGHWKIWSDGVPCSWKNDGHL